MPRKCSELYQLLLVAVTSCGCAAPTRQCQLGPTVDTGACTVRIRVERRLNERVIRWRFANGLGVPVWIPTRWREEDLPLAFYWPSGDLAFVSAWFHAGKRRMLVDRALEPGPQRAAVTRWEKVEPGGSYAGALRIEFPYELQQTVVNPYMVGAMEDSIGKSRLCEDGGYFAIPLPARSAERVWLAMEYQLSDPSWDHPPSDSAIGRKLRLLRVARILIRDPAELWPEWDLFDDYQLRHTREFTRLAVSNVEEVLVPFAPPPADEIRLLGTKVRHKDPNIRVTAIDTLGALGRMSRHAVQDLARALEDEAEVVREHAASALGLMETEAAEAVPALARAVRGDPSPDVRSAAARALGEIRSPTQAAVSSLVEALADKGRAVALHAAGALVYFERDAKAAVPALISVLRHHADPGVRLNAISCLRGVGPAAKGALPELIRLAERVRASATQTPREEGLARQAAYAVAVLEPTEGRIAALIAQLEAPDVDLRRHAAGALADIGPPAKAAVASLGRALRDEDPRVRWDAALALGMIGVASDPIVRELHTCLRARERNVRLLAAFALAQIDRPSKEALELLQETAKYGSGWLRLRATQALARIRGHRSQSRE